MLEYLHSRIRFVEKKRNYKNRFGNSASNTQGAISEYKSSQAIKTFSSNGDLNISCCQNRSRPGILFLLLWSVNCDDIWEGSFRTLFSFRIPIKHDLNLYTKNTLQDNIKKIISITISGLENWKRSQTHEILL